MVSVKKHPRRHSCRAGMSLIEVLIAIGVVATGLLGLLSVFIAGQRATDFGANISVATGYCRDILEIVRAQGLVFNYGDTGGIPNLPPADSGLNDGPSVRRDLNATPPIAFSSLVSDFSDLANENVGDQTRFTRNITTERIATGPTDYRNPLFRVTARVYWMERGVERTVKLVAVARQQ